MESDGVAVAILGDDADALAILHHQFLGRRAVHNLRVAAVKTGAQRVDEAYAGMIDGRMRALIQRARALADIGLIRPAQITKPGHRVVGVFAHGVDQLQVGHLVARVPRLKCEPLDRIEQIGLARRVVRVILLLHFGDELRVFLAHRRFGQRVFHERLHARGHFHFLLHLLIRAVEDAAGNQRIAADIAFLFNQDDARALVGRCHGRGQARAACADDDHVRGIFGRLRRFLFRRLHQRGNVTARLLGRLAHGRNQRVAGHRRARNRIHREGLLVQNGLRQFGKERLFAHALALVMVDDIDLLDLVLGERRFHRHRAVVALRGRGVGAGRKVRRGLLFAARLRDGLRNCLLERRAGNRRARNAIHIRALRVEHRLRHARQGHVAQTRRFILADHVDGRHRVRVKGHIHHHVAAHAFGTLAIGARRIRAVRHSRNRARHEQERKNSCCRLLHRFFPPSFRTPSD